MVRPRPSPRSLRGCCSSPRSCWRCVCDHARFIPVGFILGLQAYAYVVLTFSISISYTLIHRRRFFQAVLQLLLTHVLLGGAALSLILTVFRNPGTPKNAELEEGREAIVAHGALSDQSLDASGGQEGGAYADEQGALANENDQAPLLSRDEAASAALNGHGDRSAALRAMSSGKGTASSHTAPLLTSGPSSLLPGQPVFPARTDRDQLADQLSLAERLGPLSSSANAVFTSPSGELAAAALSTNSSGAAVLSASGALNGSDARHGRVPSGRSRAGSTARMSGLMLKSTGEARWCNKCVGPKPDRAHHCSTCRKCVLRMDHHCPWLGGCVGLRNHKAFFLFLSYTSLACVYALQESARALLRWISDEKNGGDTTPITWAILLLIGFIFSIALVPFAAYHAYLMCKNKTTIESMEDSGRFRLPSDRLRNASSGRPSRVNLQDRLRQIVADQPGAAAQYPQVDQRPTDSATWRADEELTREERKALKKANKLNVYDVGIRRNWRMMMGQTWWEWFLPWGDPSTDGFCYDINMRALHELDRITVRIRTGQDPPLLRDDEDTSSDSEDGSGATARDRERSDSTELGRIRVGEGDQSEMTRSEQRRAAAHGRVPLVSGSGRDVHWESGHGEAEWGAPPRRDFVLYDVDSEDEAA